MARHPTRGTKNAFLRGSVRDLSPALQITIHPELAPTARPERGGWRARLNRRSHFYSVLALSVGLGIASNFTTMNPIKALYWSAVINGVLAAPIMTMLMLLVRSRKVMGDLVVHGWLYAFGWASTFTMALCIVGMLASILVS